MPITPIKLSQLVGWRSGSASDVFAQPAQRIFLLAGDRIDRRHRFAVFVELRIAVVVDLIFLDSNRAARCCTSFTGPFTTNVVTTLQVRITTAITVVAIMIFSALPLDS